MDKMLILGLGDASSGYVSLSLMSSAASLSASSQKPLSVLTRSQH